MAVRGGFGLRSWVTALVTLVGMGAIAPFAGCQADDTEAEDAAPGVSADAGKSRDAGTPGREDVANGNGGDTADGKDGGGGRPVADAHVIELEGGSKDDVDGGHDATGTTDTCVPDYGPCGSGLGECCNLACSSGACGGFLAEGEHCTYDGGTPPDGAPPCSDRLACNHGFCGTSACVPDGRACGPDAGGVVCCNDDCNGVTCGGT